MISRGSYFLQCDGHDIVDLDTVGLDTVDLADYN